MKKEESKVNALASMNRVWTHSIRIIDNEKLQRDFIKAWNELADIIKTI